MVQPTVVLSTQYASDKTINDVFAGAEHLAAELRNRGIEQVVICNNGVSRNSIFHDAENLKNVVNNLEGRKVVVGYSRGGSVAVYAHILGMEAIGIVTIEAPINGAQAWVLKILGFDMGLRGVKDMVKGSVSSFNLVNGVHHGRKLPAMLEITGLVGRTIAGKWGLNIFTPIGNNVRRTWKPIHGGKGWLEPETINATVSFIHELQDSNDILREMVSMARLGASLGR